MEPPKPIYQSKGAIVCFVILMILRIISYFSLFPESVLLTQLIKTVMRVLLTGISFIWLISLKNKFPQYKVEYHNFTPFILYCAYLFLGLLSVFWTSSIPKTLLQLSMVVEAVVFAWFFIQLLAFYNKISLDQARFSRIFGWAVLIIYIAFIIGLWVAPEYVFRQTHGGEVSRLGGLVINPNELGMLAVLGAIMAYVEMRTVPIRGMQIWLLITAIAVLLLTQSRSSLFAFLLISGITVLLSGNGKLIMGAITVAVLTVPVLVRTIIFKQGNVEEVMSMTGRLPFWNDLITYGFPEEPLLGYGFMRLGYYDKFDSIHAYAASMAHNTFVQVLMNLGLVGAFIVLFQMIATVFVVSTSKEKYFQFLAGLMFICLLINSITEFGIFGDSNYGIQFYQFLFLFFAFKVKKQPPKFTHTVS